MLLPAECLEQLKCSLCKRLLSKFPIYVTNDDNNQLLSVCGRCQIPSNDKNYLRNTIYESAMKNIQFPCINRQNGCMEYLLPENIEQHELLCQYQSIKCKICEWEGQFFTVLDHYQTKHADLILKNYKLKMNIKEDSNSSNILLHKEAIFSFDCNFDQNLKRIKCTLTPLFSTRNVRKYYAQVNLMIDNIIMLNRFPEIDLDENEAKSLDINIEKVLHDDVTEAVGVIIITTDVKELNLHYIRKQNEENLPKSKYNIDMFASCQNTAKSDIISQALKGNRIISCQYGCGTRFLAYGMKKHYNSCLKTPYNCLFCSCVDLRSSKEVILREDLSSHIFSKHRRDYETLTKEYLSTIEIKMLPIQRYCRCLSDREGNEFILIIQLVEQYLLLWRIEVLKSRKGVNNYTFEIIMFNEKNKAKLSLKAACAELTCNKNYNINDTPCIWLHVEQVQQFMSNDNILSFNLIVRDGNAILGQ